jgi:hypothetical protein
MESTKNELCIGTKTFILIAIYSPWKETKKRDLAKQFGIRLGSVSAIMIKK